MTGVILAVTWIMWIGMAILFFVVAIGITWVAIEWWLEGLGGQWLFIYSAVFAFGALGVLRTGHDEFTPSVSIPLVLLPFCVSVALLIILMIKVVARRKCEQAQREILEWAAQVEVEVTSSDEVVTEAYRKAYWDLYDEGNAGNVYLSEIVWAKMFWRMMATLRCGYTNYNSRIYELYELTDSARTWGDKTSRAWAALRDEVDEVEGQLEGFAADAIFDAIARAEAREDAEFEEAADDTQAQA